MSLANTLRSGRAIGPLFALSLVLISFPASALADDAEILSAFGPDSVFAQKVAELAADDAFSGAVMVALHGEPVFEAAYGLADREAGLPNKTDTLYNMGSMNKMFTAVAIGQLLEQGKLSLSDPVGKYLSGFDGAVADGVTIEQLLTHTSGLGNFLSDPAYLDDGNDLRTVGAVLELVKEQVPSFTPGDRHQYSNTGFLILGAIVEAASGQDYYAYIREHIYVPAGMIRSDSHAKDKPAENMARGYARSQPADTPRASAIILLAEGQPVPEGFPADGLVLRGAEAEAFKQAMISGPREDNYATLPLMGSPAGGGYSTLADMLAFSLALTGNRLLSPETTALFTSGKIANGPDSAYAYGFEDKNWGGRKVIGHSGGAPGVNAVLRMVPELDLTLVVLANYDNVVPAVEDLFQQTLAEIK